MAGNREYIWDVADLQPKTGENGIVYFTLISKRSLTPGLDSLIETQLFNPALEQPRDGTIEVFFYDEAYTQTVRKPGRYIDEAWWSAFGPPTISWEELKASPRIFSTTAGMWMGFLAREYPFGSRGSIDASPKPKVQFNVKIVGELPL